MASPVSISTFFAQTEQTIQELTSVGHFGNSLTSSTASGPMMVPDQLATERCARALGGQYQKHGLKALYPENWSVTDSPEWELPFELAFESPDGALMTVTICDQQSSTDDLLKEYLAGLQQQYEDIEMTPSERELGGFVGVGVDAMFYCLDFLVSAELRVYSAGPYRFAILSQAESREFDRHRLVFDAIAISLLREFAK